MIRKLILEKDENKKKIQQLVDYASKPENYYYPDTEGTVPGDISEHVANLSGIRCVFSLTVLNNVAYRHLSLSGPEKGELPNATVSFTIATWFGFTGARVDNDVSVAPGRWQMGSSEDHLALIFAQDIKTEDGGESEEPAQPEVPSDDEMSRLFSEEVQRAVSALLLPVADVLDANRIGSGVPSRVAGAIAANALILLGMHIARHRGLPNEAIMDVVRMSEQVLLDPNSMLGRSDEPEEPAS